MSLLISILFGGAFAFPQTFQVPSHWEKSKIPLRPAFWSLEYDSFGQVKFDKDALIFAPSPPIANDTHSVLLLSSLSLPAEEFYIRVQYEVLDQQRPVPNPWETFWLFWAYEKQGKEKDTAYLIVKEKEIEIGHAYGLTGQNFLYTQPFDKPLKLLNASQNLEVLRLGESLGVRINEGSWLRLPKDKLTSLPNRKSPFGLYCEDSKIRIQSVEIRKP